MADAIAASMRSESYDTVQLEGVHFVRYVPVIRATDPSVSIIADWHNIESELFERYATNNPSIARRLYARRTAQLVQKAENILLEICDRHTVASDRERALLQLRAPNATIDTVPNGVDVHFFDAVNATKSPEHRREILFVGTMNYHANVDAALWLAREIWPLVRRRFPELRLTIVGRDPTPAVRMLAADDIEITGVVDDVRPYYQRALAVVTPLRVGSGTRLKILEAFAARVPVISTSLGAEGLSVINGTNALLASTGEDFVDAIGRLAAEPALRQQLARQGHRLVTDVYDWESIGAALYQIHLAASKERSARSTRF